MVEALATFLTEENRLRSWVLSWDLPGVRLQFFDDASAALAAAREEEVWLFLYDARGHEATMEGVVRPPSGLLIILASPPSMTATHELVVPRSIPIILLMSFPP